MIKFKQHLSESVETSSAFDAAKDVASYIPGAKAKQHFVESIDELVSAAKNKEIYNARFNESKTWLLTGIRYAYEAMFNKISKDIRDSGQETADLWSISSAADITKVFKIYNKMATKNKEAMKFMDSIKDVPAAIKAMKPYIRSGRAPAVPKPGQFVKPISSPAAQKLAMSFMTEATNSFSKELRASVTKQITTAYEKIKNLKLADDLPKKDNDAMIVAEVIFIVRTKDKKKVLELINGHEKRVKKIIDDNVNGIVNGFISKNTSKLALILAKKDSPKSHKIIRTNISQGMVENTMSFEFNDGSSFILQSSVIYKQSQTGKLFFQYPTRFKDVKLADGSKMKMPSEEKMIKDF
jgi:hypothetical protein